MNAITTKTRYFFDQIVRNNAFLLIFIILLFFISGLWILDSGDRSGLFFHFKDPGLVLRILMAMVMLLTVVSISLLTVVLHHASSYITPKIVLRVVSHFNYQAILGFYLGNMFYLGLLFSANPEEVPALAVTLGLCFGIISLGLFVYFVQSIFRRVYGRGIVYDIYNRTKKQLDQAIKEKQYILEGMLPQTSAWKVLHSPVSGYLHRIARQGLMKHGFKVQVLVPRGTYVVQGTPLLRVESNGRLDEKVGQELLDYCKINLQRSYGDTFTQGIGQITEIAVKSLSATTNDTDTAIHCIHCLTDLFRLRTRFADHATVSDANGEVKIYIPEMTLKELMYLSLAPVREYGKSDAKVMLTLLNALNSLMGASNNKRNHSILLYNAGAIIEAAKKNIDNAADREKLNTVIEAINANANTDRYLHYLKSPVMAGS